jgi:hypothetical protein
MHTTPLNTPTAAASAGTDGWDEFDDLADLADVDDDLAAADDELTFDQVDLRVSVGLDQEMAAVRQIEPRADAKAGALLSLSSALLVAALAVFGSGKLPAAAAAAAATGAGLLGLAVLLLTVALRPRLGGDFGFPRWARAATDSEVLHVLATGPAVDSHAAQLEQARRLRVLSVGLYAKFARMRTAQTLTGLALAAGVVAAVLSAMGR